MTSATAWNPPLNQWINIHIEQNQRSDGKYEFKLRLDDSPAFTLDISNKPKTYDSVRFEAGKGSCSSLPDKNSILVSNL